MPHPTHPATPVALAAGRSLALHAPAGSRLVCLSGSLLVRRPPRWMAEQMVQLPPLSLREGELVRIGGLAWLRVEAGEQAQFALLAPPPGRAALALAALTGRIRRLWRGRPPARAGRTA